MMKTLLLLLLYTAVVIELCWTGKISSSSCQKVYPSEYAYHGSSVYRNERASAKCRAYPLNGYWCCFHTEDYTHCDGTQLRLTDSDLGSDQYNSSDYYVWIAGSSRHLLFIFPTRVNLTTITLHYYCNSIRGLPKLRFYAVPDDFEIWDAPTASYSSVHVDAVPPGGEQKGLKNVSVYFNFSTRKVLMYKYSSSFTFEVSEVEFFIDCTSTTTYSTTVKSFTTPVVTSVQPTAGNGLNTTSQVDQAKATTLVARESTTEYSSQRVNTLSLSISEVVAWVLVSILTVLVTGLLTVIVLWLYKKRQSRDIDERVPKYEIEGNPCYEVTAVKQTTDVETHVYEAVKEGGAK